MDIVAAQLKDYTSPGVSSLDFSGFGIDAKEHNFVDGRGAVSDKDPDKQYYIGVSSCGNDSVIVVGADSNVKDGARALMTEYATEPDCIDDVVYTATAQELYDLVSGDKGLSKWIKLI